MGSIILVALGSNVASDVASDKLSLSGRLHTAILQLKAEGLALSGVSRFYKTPCFPAGAGPDYVNAAATFRNDQQFGAKGVMSILHRVEARHGRRRDSRWGPRTLDLDLLAYDDAVLPDPQTYRHWRDLPPEAQARMAPEQLILPHPRMQDRGFVLLPLADVAPDWRHPVIDRTVAQMLAALPEEALAGISVMSE